MIRRIAPNMRQLLQSAAAGSPAWRSWRYRWIEPGYLRLCVCGWRILLVDTRRRRPCLHDRAAGVRLGRMLVRVSRLPATNCGTAAMRGRQPQISQIAQMKTKVDTE